MLLLIKGMVDEDAMKRRWDIREPIAGKRLPYKLTPRGSCAPIAIGPEHHEPNLISHHRPNTAALHLSLVINFNRRFIIRNSACAVSRSELRGLRVTSLLDNSRHVFYSWSFLSHATSQPLSIVIVLFGPNSIYKPVL